MQLAPPIYLKAQSQVEASPWEFALRYFAATAATLIAIAGAQLVVRNEFVIILTLVTLVGVPVSLYLRLRDMHIGSWQLPRPLWNAVTVIGTFLSASYYVFWSLRDLLLPILHGGSPQAFLLRFGAGESVSLLMQVFLLFAAFRSFALISDKDATLTTVPSFSVLLLLIPVHKGIEVVFYFLAWTVVATVLFALDHRSEVRVKALAYVPCIAPGQDVRLAGRSLATILAVSLSAAVGISYFLTSRDPQQRSSAETAISSLVTRLTSMALSLPETSVNSGPERQIDFSSSPSPASRSALWQVRAWTYGGKPLRPEYWRLFSLSKYNGVTWSQSSMLPPLENVIRVRQTDIDLKRWPARSLFRRPDASNYNFGGSFNPRDFPPNYSFPGFDVQRASPPVARQFGPGTTLIRQNVIAILPNLGFVPAVPSVRALSLPSSDQKEVRLQRDGGLDLGVVEPGQQVRLLSDVPGLSEYGVPRGSIPVKNLSIAQIKRSGLELSPSERRAQLALPFALPARVRELGKKMLADAAPNESSYRRAQRIALSIQENSVYTLRPPTIPSERDAADFFLFEGRRRGYCTYFAGALAVLCRTQGIPARVVSGFVNPEWSDGASTGLLREANAHAWTEVWVDGWGWAIVDATPAGDRGDNAPTWLESWTDWFASTVDESTRWVRERLVIFGIGSAIGVVLILFFWKKRRFSLAFKLQSEPREDAERRAVIEIYRQTSRRITKRFRPRAGWETPDEWLQPFAANLPVTDAEALRRLTSLYMAARYAGRPLPQGSAQLARKIFAGIGWKKMQH